jgi:hypothetical protein
MSASSSPDELEPALVSLLASIADVPAQRDFIASFLRAGGWPTMQSVANLHHIHDMVINQLREPSVCLTTTWRFRALMVRVSLHYHLVK